MTCLTVTLFILYKTLFESTYKEPDNWTDSYLRFIEKLGGWRRFRSKNYSFLHVVLKAYKKIALF
jgi:hypothetical protein